MQNMKFDHPSNLPESVQLCIVGVILVFPGFLVDIYCNGWAYFLKKQWLRLKLLFLRLCTWGIQIATYVLICIKAIQVFIIKLRLILVPFYMPFVKFFKKIRKDMNRDFQFTENLAIVDRVLKVRMFAKVL
ncbi:Oidioi.mRNA.OKI2018_I69.chr2.g5880.t1.cds [Oikopleura dioica]|uniref:Oidioi.mRNA.OKI2018_I69.chr2.g5880.t1.cds n=1 Tax=Oikopleura dioica TaxID=34765 RepID=A0ABN7T896_OIKDI|nr:Oidioi.mRNA.OKI2018_I69.chr2.g5880.t1.cds [Oikopleura dioica]